MIKLEDVSIDIFKRKLQNLNPYENLEENLSVLFILDNYSIATYGQIEEQINLGNPDFNKDIFRQELEDVKKTILLFSKAYGVEPQIYKSNGYKLGIIDLRSLQITDKYTFGRNLIIKSPTNTRYTTKDIFISSHSIEDLKYMLSHVYPTLDNVLLCRNYYFKKEDILNLIKAINFYEEQVIRQAQEIKKDKSIHLPRNVFEYDKDIKRELVEEQIKEIIDYLTSSSSSYIWGKLSDTEKLRLIKSTSNNENLIIRRNIVEMIANYTTLSEIENGLKTKTLKRFIAR